MEPRRRTRAGQLRGRVGDVERVDARDEWTSAPFQLPSERARIAPPSHRGPPRRRRPPSPAGARASCPGRRPNTRGRAPRGEERGRSARGVLMPGPGSPPAPPRHRPPSPGLSRNRSGKSAERVRERGSSRGWTRSRPRRRLTSPCISSGSPTAERKAAGGAASSSSCISFSHCCVNEDFCIFTRTNRSNIKRISREILPVLRGGLVAFKEEARASRGDAPLVGPASPSASPSSGT